MDDAVIELIYSVSSTIKVVAFMYVFYLSSRIYRNFMPQRPQINNIVEYHDCTLAKEKYR